jgi:predicted nucleic acid-binding protein
VTSAYVLEEYRRACIHKLGMDHRRVDRSAAFIVSSAEVIPLFHALRSWCDEPGDDAIVETAVVGKVDFLVTGDRVLLDSCIDVVRVVTPRAFADTLGIE